MPQLPRSPRFGDDQFRPGGGGFPGAPEFQWIFKCSKCNRELGRGKSSFDEPPYDKCPHCGVSFSNKGNFGWSNAGSGPSQESLNNARKAGAMVGSIVITLAIILIPMAMIIGTIILVVVLVRRSNAKIPARRRVRRRQYDDDDYDDEDDDDPAPRRRKTYS